jgi:acetyl-CoA acetyltransferase
VGIVEYGVVAAQAALADAGVEWRDIQFVSGADTMRNGYPGYVAGATFAQALGWQGASVASSYAACASGATALNTARAQILAGLCDVALVVGADTTPKGFLAPNAGERGDDPDWLRFRLLGATNPTYFALYARRRMEMFGATPDDFAKVKVKNARHGLQNPYARYRKEVTLETSRRRVAILRCWDLRHPTVPRPSSLSMDREVARGR